MGRRVVESRRGGDLDGVAGLENQERCETDQRGCGGCCEGVEESRGCEEDEIGKLRVMWRVAIALQNAGMSPIHLLGGLKRNTQIYYNQVTRSEPQHSSKPKPSCKPLFHPFPKTYLYSATSIQNVRGTPVFFMVCPWTPSLTP
jgi:hypothetical protein